MQILIADDHPIVRDGLKTLLEKEHDLQVVAMADHGREALRLALVYRPDIMLIDIAMPEMNGIEAITRIIAEIPAAKIVVLSMHSERRFVLEALHAGAKGYLLKDCACEELVNAVRTVAAGSYFFSTQISETVINACLRKSLPASDSAFTRLSPREREVLQLIAEGKGTKEIAFSFGVSPKTVETQRMQLMRKLEISNVAELTKYAIREGLTTL